MFKVETFYVICDSLISEIKRRSTVYDDVYQNFRVFEDLQLTEDIFSKCVDNLINIYREDIDPIEFKG